MAGFLSFALVLVSAPARAGNDTELAGDWLQVLIPSAAWGSTFIHNDAEGRGQFYRSFGTAMLITHGLKLAISAPRPNDGADNSFPSGHTAAAFSGAAFFHHRYGWRWGVPAYLAASFVGYSRVHAQRHHTRDVIAGAALAIATSHYFVTPHGHGRITPYVAGDRLGVFVTYRY